MPMPSTVSIAILNYNYERYLADAIDSALAQTHPYVEVIVVDDGSMDGSVGVIRGYGDRVAAILKENGGQGSAMNAGFAAATGDVVIFLDADDRLAPGTAAAVAAAFERRPDAAWVMYRLRMIDGEGRPIGRVRPRRPGVMPDGDLREHLATYRCFHWQPTSGNAFARAALEQVMPMPAEDYRISADAYLAGVVPLCGTVRSLDEVLGDYRVHGRSAFTDAAIDETYFRSQIERQVATHEHTVRLGRQLGVDVPADPRAPRDAAFTEFRLASLLLAPEHHPYPEERRSQLGRQGIGAALANPELSWPTRLRRASWFTAAGLMPRWIADRAVAWAPDTPAARARRTATTRGRSGRR